MTRATMPGRLKITRGGNNVFRDVGFSRAESEVRLLRAKLMNRIEDNARSSRLSSRRLAARRGVSQSRLNGLLKGKIAKLNVDALVNMLGHAGLRIELKVKKAA